MRMFMLHTKYIWLASLIGQLNSHPTPLERLLKKYVGGIKLTEYLKENANWSLNYKSRDTNMRLTIVAVKEDQLAALLMTETLTFKGLKL